MGSEPAEAKNTEEEHTVEVELTSEMHDRLLSLQAPEEDLADTIERVLPLIPHGVTFRDAGIDPECVDAETQFILERWSNGSDTVGHVFASKNSYIKSNAELIDQFDAVEGVGSE